MISFRERPQKTFATRSGLLPFDIKAHVKQQEIKQLVAVSTFFYEVPWYFGCYSIQLDIVR